MATAVSQSQPCMNRLDAARLLLEVSPAALVSDTESAPSSGNSVEPMQVETTTISEMKEEPMKGELERAVVTPELTSLNLSQSESSLSGVGGLDALAALASTCSMEGPQQTASFSSDEEETANMPPPPPRRGRMRSASNPEGMEKWDSLKVKSRQHFFLPSSILEEELAQCKTASEAKDEEEDCVMQEEKSDKQSLPEKKLGAQAASTDAASDSQSRPAESEPPLDESNIEPAELLRRARSRLLEDLSEGSITGEKGVLTLPHSLNKYKEVYNKNGRIGIYTPGERAAIIARFHGKRSRRVWNKKIRYNCRKNLADRRMRVKGRFVKRSTEAMAKAAKEQAQEEAVPKDRASDEEMPNVNDPEAGFSPTEDQPYRRTRRHTIT